MHYLKTSSWELDPLVKAFPPEDAEVQVELNPDVVYDNNALFSIDGERYKSQKIKAVVLSKYLPVYM